MKLTTLPMAVAVTAVLLCMPQHHTALALFSQATSTRQATSAWPYKDTQLHNEPSSESIFTKIARLFRAGEPAPRQFSLFEQLHVPGSDKLKRLNWVQPVGPQEPTLRGTPSTAQSSLWSRVRSVFGGVEPPKPSRTSYISSLWTSTTGWLHGFGLAARMAAWVLTKSLSSGMDVALFAFDVLGTLVLWQLGSSAIFGPPVSLAVLGRLMSVVTKGWTAIVGTPPAADALVFGRIPATRMRQARVGIAMLTMAPLAFVGLCFVAFPLLLFSLAARNAIPTAIGLAIATTLHALRYPPFSWVVNRTAVTAVLLSYRGISAVAMWSAASGITGYILSHYKLIRARLRGEEIPLAEMPAAQQLSLTALPTPPAVLQQQAAQIQGAPPAPLTVGTGPLSWIDQALLNLGAVAATMEPVIDRTIMGQHAGLQQQIQPQQMAAGQPTGQPSMQQGGQQAAGQVTGQPAGQPSGQVQQGQAYPQGQGQMPQQAGPIQQGPGMVGQQQGIQPSGSGQTSGGGPGPKARLVDEATEWDRSDITQEKGPTVTVMLHRDQPLGERLVTYSDVVQGKSKVGGHASDNPGGPAAAAIRRHYAEGTTAGDHRDMSPDESRAQDRADEYLAGTSAGQAGKGGGSAKLRSRRAGGGTSLKSLAHEPAIKSHDQSHARQEAATQKRGISTGEE